MKVSCFITTRYNLFLYVCIPRKTIYECIWKRSRAIAGNSISTTYNFYVHILWDVPWLTTVTDNYLSGTLFVIDSPDICFLFFEKKICLENIINYFWKSLISPVKDSISQGCYITVYNLVQSCFFLCFYNDVGLTIYVIDDDAAVPVQKLTKIIYLMNAAQSLLSIEII